MLNKLDELLLQTSQLIQSSFQSMKMDSIGTYLTEFLTNRDIVAFYINPFLAPVYGQEGNFNIIVITKNDLILDFVFKEDYSRHDISHLFTVTKIYYQEIMIMKDKQEQKAKQYFGYLIHTRGEITSFIGINEKDKIRIKEILSYIETKVIENRKLGEE